MNVRKKLIILGYFLILLISGSSAINQWLNPVMAAPSAPTARHCRDISPLDDEDWCGCTWGKVLFQGRSVSGITVTLSFEGSNSDVVTFLSDDEPFPYFSMTGADLGAHRGDMMTLTAQIAGQSIEHSFRALPDSEGEQEVSLVFLEQGIWSPFATGGYTRTMVLENDTAWAGGSAGILAIDLASGAGTPHTLPGSDQDVKAIAVGIDGHIWTAVSNTVAEYDGTTWHVHPNPTGGTLRTLAVNPANGHIWLGGGDDTQGTVAVYDGSWQVAGVFGVPVTAVTIDKTGRTWAATWGDGVYRQDGNGGWTHYRIADGLASDWVLSATTTAEAVWFGTKPYISSEHGPRGGIARYDLNAGIWQTYMIEHGLPPDIMLPQAPAPVYSLAAKLDGSVLAGTEQGVSFLVDEIGWWGIYTATHGLESGMVTAVAANSTTTLAASMNGIDQLDSEAVPGTAPTAQIITVSPSVLTVGTNLELEGSGVDGDEGGEKIVAWDWSSSLDGPLCTTASCSLPYHIFSPGTHVIEFRVLDDEGVWSTSAIQEINVQQAEQIFLPLVSK